MINRMLFLFIFLPVVLVSGEPKFIIKTSFQQDVMVETDYQLLEKQIDEVIKYLVLGHEYDSKANHGGKIDGLPSNLESNIKTLTSLKAFIKNRKQAVTLGELQSLFHTYHWLPNTTDKAEWEKKKAIFKTVEKDSILLTKYYVRLGEGEDQKSVKSPFALYALPKDEEHLSVEEAFLKRDSLLRFRFGKQEIIKGVLEDKLDANPLIWVNRADLEGALMQGTIVIGQNDKKRFFNVHRCNEIAYDRMVKPEEQERYWYFKEVQHVLGYGKDANFKVGVFPEIAVAGDIAYFGLGRVFLMETSENGKRVFCLTILADTGGAFENNQLQLDWLRGYYANWKEYHQANKHISDSCKVYLLNSK